MKSDTPFLSVVIPVLNEKENVAQLHQEIVAACVPLKKPFEIIFVDDGSGDGTVEVIKKLSPVKLIVLRRSYGQTAALDAGIKAAQGELIVTMDGDLQNDPADIPNLLNELNEKNVDFVCGWRAQRKDSFSKRFISKGARWLRSFLVNDGIHDSGCTLRIYKHECFEGLTIRGEMHRFIPAMLQWRGFKLSEIPVNHRARLHGQTKYNFKRTIKGFLDMLNIWFFRKFSTRPLHFLGGIGIFCSSLGLSMLLLLLIIRVFFQVSIMDSIWPLMAVFLTLFGVQMFVSGLIMDLIISTNENSLYAIKETTEK